MDFSEISDLLNGVRDRLDTAKIKYEDNSIIDDNSQNIELLISFPQGSETRELYLFDDDDLESFADTEFEKLILLKGFSAIANLKSGKIEAIITAPNDARTPTRRRSLLKRIGLIESDNSILSKTLYSSELDDPTIKIGPSSKSIKVLTQTPGSIGLSLTINYGAELTHNSALDLLERTANSFLFSIDLEYAVHLSILRRPISRKRTSPPANPGELEYPKYEYDRSPMALYWYARGAEGMPLLQYLAFYQVIEYYYPAYFNSELGRRIRTIIKNPTFRVDRDLDVAKIVATLGGKGQSVSGEREQLRATVKECLSSTDVEEFLASNPDRPAFFTSKPKGTSSFLINPQNRQMDLPIQVAERIYDIRCKIVHTKGDHNDGEIELLLPNSSEAEKLGHDIDLVRFVAQKVLISSSKLMRPG
nr:hypothetical protein [uncultured Duganella sp.]